MGTDFTGNMTFEPSPFVSIGRVYAGIGSRATPVQSAPKLTGIARRLTDLGYTLRSGRAPGADTYFERGARPSADLFVPSGATNSRTPAGARIIVPSGDILNRCLLIAKNVPQIQRLATNMLAFFSRGTSAKSGANSSTRPSRSSLYGANQHVMKALRVVRQSLGISRKPRRPRGTISPSTMTSNGFSRCSTSSNRSETRPPQSYEDRASAA